MAMTLTLDDETAALLTAEAGRRRLSPAEFVRTMLPGLRPQNPSAAGAVPPEPDHPGVWQSGFRPEFEGMLPSRVLAMLDEEHDLARLNGPPDRAP